jgi:spore photoproduct lyase
MRELARLIFEINLRGGVTPYEILPFTTNLNFESAKKLLLKKRYPKNYGKVPLSSFYLPKIDLDFYSEADLSGKEFYPKQIFIDAEAENSALAARVKKIFPSAGFKILKEKTAVGSYDYSKRTETLYISHEKFDFIKSCPCTSGAAGCGYNLVNLGFGCVYECAYCFLQEYQNLHAVVLPANPRDFLAKIDGVKLNKGPFKNIRIGSGEFTDSLVFDYVTNYSKEIIEFFRCRPHIDFEFKTKSVNTANILDCDPCKNIVIGWSVNTPEIIKNAEYLTPPLDARLNAAAKVSSAGFGVAFHFDPVIIYDGWKRDYEEVIKRIRGAVPPENVRWLSVGTLRFNRGLKKIIESRHRKTKILLEEFMLGFDGKMRYGAEQRKEVYGFMVPLLEKYFPQAYVYLCMEQNIFSSVLPD